MGAIADLGSVFSRWHTWWLMGNQDLSMRYRRSLLGPFWISISMAVMILGMVTLYSDLFKHDFKVYLVFVGCGILVWNFINTLLLDGCRVAIEGEGHLRSIPTPLPLLVARMVYRSVLIFLHNVVAVLVLFVAFSAVPERMLVLEAVAGLLIITLIGFFAALVFAPICVRFRDVLQVITSIMQMMMFLTPVFWMPSQGRVSQHVSNVNPFYHLLEVIRAPMSGHHATETNWAVALGLFAGFAALGLIVLSASRKRIFLWL